MEKSSLKQRKNRIIIILLISVTTIFCMPSIIYLLQNKTIYYFGAVWTYFFKIPTSANEKMINAIIFFVLMTTMFLLYLLITKKQKQIFRNNKQIFFMIAIISILFTIVIPYTSTDVYGYIAPGWIAANYSENPYYISAGEILDSTGQNDPMLNKMADCWKYDTVVYGPLWTGICTIFSWLSFGNIDIALFIFKLANLIIHLLNCLLVYKITRKRIFLLLYGLNIFILFEGLSNVHNDLWIIFFLLLAIYFTIRKKNLWFAVAFVACATAIKYLAILILPFIVIYYVRKKNVKERILYCFLCGVEYIAILAVFYLIYMRDLQVFAGLLIQQGRYNRSIFYILSKVLEKQTLQTIQITTIGLFAVFYICVCIKLLLRKEMKFYQVIKQYNVFLFIFTFILITNFNAWYIMWLFPTMFWLKRPSQETILAISYSSQIANFSSFALWSEAEWLSIPYFIIIFEGAGIIKLLNKIINNYFLKLKNVQKIK